MGLRWEGKRLHLGSVVNVKHGLCVIVLGLAAPCKISQSRSPPCFQRCATVGVVAPAPVRQKVSQLFQDFTLDLAFQQRIVVSSLRIQIHAGQVTRRHASLGTTIPTITRMNMCHCIPTTRKGHGRHQREQQIDFM